MYVLGFFHQGGVRHGKMASCLSMVGPRLWHRRRYMCSIGLRCGPAHAFLFRFRNDLNPTSPGILCVDRSLLAVSALHFQIRCAIGSRNSSVSRASPEVALKAPDIVLTAALPCKLFRIFIVCCVYPTPVSFAMDHAEHHYNICGTTVAW